MQLEAEQSFECIVSISYGGTRANDLQEIGLATRRKDIQAERLESSGSSTLSRSPAQKLLVAAGSCWWTVIARTSPAGTV